jgi:hypothetical protein
MTPKEKAEDLFQKMYNKLKDTKAIFLEYKSDKNSAKQCALIAVDEILNGYEFDSLDIKHKRIMDNINYWDEVKQEIENL